MNRWKRVVEALTRLAEDQKGKPEGDVARQKLRQILDKYPEARHYRPVVDFIKRDLTLRDIRWMKRHAISTDGLWTGRNLNEAITVMQDEYKRRIRGYQEGQRERGPRRLLDAPVG